MPRKKQISLFDGNNTEREIKKHSSIVQIGNVTTLQERKAMNTLIRVAKDMLKRNPEQRSFTCDLGVIKRLTWLNGNDNEDLKDALRNLHNNKIEYNIMNKDKKERGLFSFLAEVKIVSEGRWRPTTVSFEFPSTVWKVVKNPNMYVKLDLLIVRGLNSKHSVALYEFMKDYQNLWKYRCETEEFRRLMGIKDHQYSIFSMFRKRVLDKAVEEINEKTDIFVSYDLERKWRKIIAVLLKVQAKEENRLPRHAPQAIEEKLKGFWINSKMIQTLLDRHDEQYLRANITIVEEQLKHGKISNPAGYLLKAFQHDYRPVETEHSKQQKAEEESKQEQQVEQEKLVQEQKAKQHAFIARKKGLVLERLEGLDENKKEKHKEEFVEQMNANPLFWKMLLSKWFEDDLIQHQRHKFLETKLLTEEELQPKE